MPGLRVEVVYALPERQLAVTLVVGEGATVVDAVRASGLPTDYAGLAVYGERVAGDAPLRDGDRVELLRPLAADPRQARRARAGKGRRA